MKRVLLLLLLALLAAGCREEPKPVSEPGEKLYPLTGVILSRNESYNSLRIQHETIPGYMVAMTMEFPVRGADVESLPPDRSRITATLHVVQSSFWITDVKPAR
jgi:hypothetical protein